MAAEYLKHRASREGLSHIVVESAGILGIENARAAPLAVAILREHGLDLTHHRSRGLTTAHAQAADLIVGMSSEHLEFLDHRFPGRLAPRFLLRAFEKGPEPQPASPDLEDPVTGPVEDFRACFATIRTCVDHLVLRLKHGP